jgi:hypothetical protein
MTQDIDYTLLREEVIRLKKYAKETNDYTVQLNGRLRLLEEQRLQEKLINLGKVTSSLSKSVDGVGEQLAMVRLERNELAARVEACENDITSLANGVNNRFDLAEDRLDALEGWRKEFEEFAKLHKQIKPPKRKHKGWINVYANGMKFACSGEVHATEHEAKIKGAYSVATIQIEWED